MRHDEGKMNVASCALSLQTLPLQLILIPRFPACVPHFVFTFRLQHASYLNNRVFLSRNYRLIVAPRKFDALKTNICRRSEASRVNVLVLRTSIFKGNYQTDRSETKTLYCLYCSPLKFSSARQFKNHIELFSTFSNESR